MATQAWPWHPTMSHMGDAPHYRWSIVVWFGVTIAPISERSIPTAASPRRTPRVVCARRVVRWSLAAAAGLLLVMAWPLVAGRFYTCDDLGNLHLSVRAFYAGQLACGEPYDWMPGLQCGYHLTGEGEAGTYHPWHQLLYRLLPLQTAMGLELLASYPWLLAGAYLFLRRRLRRSDAALVGALALSFGSFALLRFVHPQAIAVFAHIPWLLWALECLLTAESAGARLLAMAAVGALTGSQVLLGYPQFLWFSLLAESLYALYRSVELAFLRPAQPLALANGRCPFRILAWAGMWIGGKALGLLLGAVQLLPTLEELPRAARLAAGSDFFNAGALHPLNLVQWIAPYLFAQRAIDGTTIESGCYLGAVPLLLIVWLRANPPRNRGLRRLAIASAVLGLLALLLALGPAGHIYSLLRMLPGVGCFRFPCRYIGLVQLAGAVLAALGFAALMRRQAQVTAARARPLLLVVLAGVLVALAGPWVWPQHVTASPWAIWAGPALLAMAAGLIWLAARGARWAPAALIVLAIVDQGYYGLSVTVLPQTERLEDYLATAVAPPGQPAGRIAVDLVLNGDPRPRIGNQLTLRGWQRVDGFVGGLEPGRQLDYHTLPALRVAGVQWVRRKGELAQIAGLGEFDEDWLAVPQPLPRARLLGDACVSLHPAADLARLDIEKTALVQQPIGLDPGASGQVLIQRDRPGRVELRVEAPGRKLVTLSESYHPGWQARIDGQPAEVLRVNGDFLGCAVGPGAHEIHFEFRPRSLQAGAALSATGLIVLFSLSCVLLAHARRRA